MTKQNIFQTICQGCHTTSTLRETASKLPTVLTSADCRCRRGCSLTLSFVTMLKSQKREVLGRRFRRLTHFASGSRWGESRRFRGESDANWKRGPEGWLRIRLRRER
jgi:hypothetical protein